jgi:hypothetical protein
MRAHRIQYCLHLLIIIKQDGKVAVRNIRRESVDKIKAAEKDKDIGKDDSKGFQVCSCFLSYSLTYLLLFFTMYVHMYECSHDIKNY